MVIYIMLYSLYNVRGITCLIIGPNISYNNTGVDLLCIWFFVS
jgi:hypothetical protein